VVSYVAVIGAGVAGLACARRLTERGVEVVVFDKGRRVGGRLSTRREDGRQFDHGAQYLTASEPGFEAWLRGLRDLEAAAEWELRVLDGDGLVRAMRRTVGFGSNRAIAEAMARGLDVRQRVQVMPFGRDRPLMDAEGNLLGDFEAVVVTAPLVQARELLVAYPAIVNQLAGAGHRPCWALMVELDAPIDGGFDAVRGHGAVAWAAREASKPGRVAGERWVIHATAEWTEAHLEEPGPVVADALLDALADAVGPLPPVVFRRAHRWRYARVDRPVGQPCLYDAEARIAVAGDGLLGPRVEAAWTSGCAAASAILRST